MFTTTAERVTANTAPEINAWIRQRTEDNIARYAHADPASITHRLAELDREWDIERCLETMAPSISLVGLFLGATVDRKWFMLPAIIQAFLLQHGLQGWCPPIPFLRRFGVRTAQEIDEERYALKAIRGDFQHVWKPEGGASYDDALLAVER